MRSLARYEAPGKMAGCFISKGNLEHCRRPPTLNTPSASTKGLSIDNVFDRGNSRRDYKYWISAWYHLLCSILVAILRAAVSSWVVKGPALSRLLNLLQYAITLIQRVQLENPSNIVFTSSLIASWQYMIRLSLRTSLEVGCIFDFGHKVDGPESHNGPCNQSELSVIASASTPRVVRSAGLSAEVTCRHFSVGSELWISDTRLAMKTFHLDGCSVIHASTVWESDHPVKTGGLSSTFITSSTRRISFTRSTAAHSSSLGIDLSYEPVPLLSWQSVKSLFRNHLPFFS